MNIHPKIAGAPIAGMIVGIGLWVLSLFTKVIVPVDVIADLTGLLGLVLSYLIPSPPTDKSGPVP